MPVVAFSVVINSVLTLASFIWPKPTAGPRFYSWSRRRAVFYAFNLRHHTIVHDRHKRIPRPRKPFAPMTPQMVLTSWGLSGRSGSRDCLRQNPSGDAAYVAGFTLARQRPPHIFISYSGRRLFL